MACQLRSQSTGTTQCGLTHLTRALTFVLDHQYINVQPLKHRYCIEGMIAD